MSGVAVIQHLLANDNGVQAVIPAAQIMAGTLPLKTPLPAISVTQVSSMPNKMIRSSESIRQHTERVQASVIFRTSQGSPSGAGYPGLKAAMKLVLAACPGRRGVINGVTVDSIVADIEGPDLSDDVLATYSCSRDFIVKYFI